MIHSISASSVRKDAPLILKTLKEATRLYCITLAIIWFCKTANKNKISAAQTLPEVLSNETTVKALTKYFI